MELHLYLTIIILLSTLQSIFGVGILIFGTPFLLFLGLEYDEALFRLLPASIGISLSQMIDYRKTKLDFSYRKSFLIICCPMIILSSLFLKSYISLPFIKFFIVAILFFIIILRINNQASAHLQTWFKKNFKFALALMGLIHGISNMGGAILTPMASSIFQNKIRILTAISFDYFFMASFQLLTLFFISNVTFKLEYLFGFIVSIVVRYLIGRKAFNFTQDKFYQNFLTLLIFCNTLMLIYSLL